MRIYRGGQGRPRGVECTGKEGLGEAIKCLQLAGFGGTMPLLMPMAPLFLIVQGVLCVFAF
ncbi:MAG: hypothetical protein DRP66_06640 [Planctomycetota bacterium]|nr:MAG: hypothetical protein DRP66_06640 [Planctomycetota bacterium]